jgi:hypothetical protein
MEIVVYIQVVESTSAESTRFLMALHTGKYFGLSARLNLQIDLWFAPATPTAISFGKFRHAESLSTICKPLVMMQHCATFNLYTLVDSKAFRFRKMS